MAFPPRLLAADERVQFELRPHPRVLLGPTVALMVIAGVTGYLVARLGVWFPEPPSLTLGLRLGAVVIALLLAVPTVVRPLSRWLTTTYVVTDQRVILRRGVLTRRGWDLPLSTLNRAWFAQRPWDRPLGCGRLTIESGAGHGMLVLADVPDVQRVQWELYRLHEMGDVSWDNRTDEVDGRG